MLDLHELYHSRTDGPLRPVYREQVLGLALLFYQGMSPDVAKLVAKEFREIMLSLGGGGPAIFDSVEAYTRHKTEKQETLRLTDLGSSRSLFIS